MPRHEQHEQTMLEQLLEAIDQGKTMVRELHEASKDAKGTLREMRETRAEAIAEMRKAMIEEASHQLEQVVPGVRSVLEKTLAEHTKLLDSEASKILVVLEKVKQRYEVAERVMSTMEQTVGPIVPLPGGIIGKDADGRLNAVKRVEADG